MSAEFKIQPLCDFFGVSRSGFYSWLHAQASPCKRQTDNQQLAKKIKAIYQDHNSLYGSPKITQALRKEGIACGHNRVARLMRQEGIKGVQSKTSVPRTTDRNHQNPVAPNLLAKLPEPPAELNQVWVTDITYLPSAEGWLYLSAIMDLSSRKIIGWHLENHLQTSLPLQALKRAIAARKPTGPVIHHSDRGCQYTSGEYTQALKQAGLIPSMSATGYCYDNAAMESFWSILKREIRVKFYQSQAQARREIFEFIEGFYNRKRLHGSIGCQSPEAFENEKLKSHFERKERQIIKRPLPPFSSQSNGNPKTHLFPQNQAV
jgi:transposase InsO family protein